MKSLVDLVYVYEAKRFKRLIKIIAPVRIWELKSREQEIDYAKAKKIPIDATKKKPYSISNSP